jgi:methylmalonyl-CoA mutase N-terminal domain/subunit
MVVAVKRNFPQREIANAAFDLQAEIDSGRRIVVGVNAYTEGGGDETPILRIDPALERKQLGRLQAVRAERDASAVEATLAALRAAAGSEQNVMPLLIDAARVNASEGEMVAALQDVWAPTLRALSSEAPA